jgi:hypothetical protein
MDIQMKDNRDPEQVGNALFEMKKLMPDLKLSEIADLHNKIGGIEAGSASLLNGMKVAHNGVREGVVESDDS